MTKLVKYLVAIAIVAGVQGFVTGEASAQRVRLQTRLTATDLEPLASGKAKFESRPDRIRFSCEAEDLMATGSAEIFHNGVSLGVENVNFGGFDLNMDSRDGDNVPIMQAGDLIEVRDAETGDLILFGILFGLSN